LHADDFASLTPALFDPSDSPQNGYAGVVILGTSGGGSLTYKGSAVPAGQFITKADIDSNFLVFTPGNVSQSQTGYASIQFAVRDTGSNLFPNDNTSDPTTTTIDASVKHSAPSGADLTVTANEDQALILGPATFAALGDGLFGFTDSDSPPYTFTGVFITSRPASGTLPVGGLPVSPGQFITVGDISTNNLKYLPAADANGTAAARFTFQVRDHGRSARRGR